MSRTGFGRSVMHRWVTALLVTAFLLVSCAPAGDSPQSGQDPSVPPKGAPDAAPLVARLAQGLQTSDLSGVQLTSSPSDATTELTTIFAGMDGITPTVTPGEITYDPDGTTATAVLAHSYPVGEEGWSFQTTVPLELVNGTWLAVWSPTVVHPQLTAETRLRHRRTQPRRAPINDRDGLALVEELTLHQLGIDKGTLEEASWPQAAQQLAQLLGIDPEAYTQKVLQGGPKQFVVARTVRQEDIPAAIGNIPGVGIIDVKSVAGQSETFAIGLLGKVGNPSQEQIDKAEGAVVASDLVGLSGLQSRYDEQLRGVAGISIDQVGRKGVQFTEVPLFTQEPSIGQPLELSLDRTLQEKAETVLATNFPTSGVAAMVVLDVRTGGVLAAATSPAAGEYPHATYGAFAPGSTFKIVTSLAMIRKGATASSTVECPPSFTLGDYTQNNYPGYPSSQTGSITLADAVAYSCNTAFGLNHDRISAEELQSAAASLGVGVDHDAGFTSNFGTVEPRNSKIDLAASMIGQGQVRMSPLGMASVAASVASGRTTIPWLVKGHEASSTATPLTEAETKELQAVMKAVLDRSRGSRLGQVMTGGKTGTAEYGDAAGQTAHAWMITWNEEYAVAAFVEDGDSGSGTAAPLIEQLFS
ncbi:penicillin-binding protein [Arachnia propionica]|uniref:Penicillin-binding protein n=1 Tax=Arachnia propionica TaxID=1750 RepID=A0A3P1T6V7_9ACTN|nr:penicillin-binding transpeptidase domain-containing protein [Arachnia propionica]RRD04556.1 penicillin-binding protein [Arachnia propionica]